MEFEIEIEFQIFRILNYNESIQNNLKYFKIILKNDFNKYLLF